MKTILIIAPHYPPSNLAAVHRSRLFAQHLPAFGWKPVLLTVHEQYYEEALDWNLYRLLPEEQEIRKVAGFRVTNPRLVGDIGLRAFFQLRQKALQLVRCEKFDFVYIPIPSFYTSLIGPYLHKKTGVKYGIDYIDPWVHYFPGSEKIFSRHWWSTRLAGWLEPIAVRKASLITGVAEGYFKGVQERNPHLFGRCIFGAMPYGGEAEDHRIVRQLGIKPYLFQEKPGITQLVYAGAFLPKAYQPLEEICKAIAADRDRFAALEFHFIGTGRAAGAGNGYSIRPLAEKYGLWQTIIYEYPARIPYLDVLVHLEAANGIFILGSTEPHYTPSKVYQAILSKKPILAVLHEKSTAFGLLQTAGRGVTIGIRENNLEDLRAGFAPSTGEFVQNISNYAAAEPDPAIFDAYSAKEVTRKLSQLLNAVCEL